MEKKQPQRRTVKKKIGLVISMASTVIGLLLFIHFYWLDGISGALWELLLGDTVYSQGYREYKFRRIHEGMTEEQVLEIVGIPLFRGSYFPFVWFYSYGKPLYKDKDPWVTDSCYTQRIIFFSGGKVSKIYHDFYFD
ncbi:hypothetical protein U14_01412 [Candidatus Moduliflexus flocculans]|uniref:Outer membrane protein assembly factor BamE domain-containing protein n=1 Tax=Candidatus Moduliflexus flocculans TaxID=1499966 RepID=A0A0S6VWP2_9BACT|nr:hypothetical protein U14_01412 [Candidatus Moduliflexus flocculans]